MLRRRRIRIALVAGLTALAWSIVSFAAAPVTRVTVERSDGARDIFGGDQIAAAITNLTLPTNAPVSVGAVTLRKVADNSVIGTFDAAGNLSAPVAGLPVYIQSEIVGASTSVEFLFGDHTTYVERTAPWTYGLQFVPLGWRAVAGSYVLAITPKVADLAGTSRTVHFTVTPPAVVRPATSLPDTLPVTTPTTTPAAGWYVKTDDGFTPFPLAPGAREYFVATNGNDAGSGSIASPFRTLQKAVAVCRNGSGDRVRPFAGSVFYGQVGWYNSAPNGFYCGIIAYGDGERPRIETTANGIKVGQSVNNAAFSGIEIVSTVRDPGNPAFQKAPVEWVGIDVRNPISQNVLIEDCRISWFGNNIAIQSTAVGKFIDGVTLNRNIILDAWASRIFGGQGVYCDLTRHLQLTGNFFDHCGWIVAPNVGVTVLPTQFRHDNYLNIGCTDIVAYDNWFFRAASYGLKDVGGGDVQYNLFWDCGNGACAWGRSSLFARNVVLGGQARADNDGAPALSGASGFSIGSSSCSVEKNYFWGRPLSQTPGMKYPSAAVDVGRNATYGLPGDMKWNVSENGFVYWPPTPQGGVNYLNLAGGDVNLFPLGKTASTSFPFLATNFKALPPDAGKVWPDQSWITALRNRPLHTWVTRSTPRQVLAEFDKANGK